MVRHAKSSWDNPGLRDFERRLNSRGQHDAPLMAQLLVQQGIKPDLIVSSPAKRALATARFFAEAFGIPEQDILHNPDIYEASASDIMRVISALPDTARVILLFGHNPAFTTVANRFADTPIDNVPTCGIVQIESDAEAWDQLHEGNARVKAHFFPKESL